MKRRHFIKSAAAFSSITLLPSHVWSTVKKSTLRTAHIGVGGMGLADLGDISSHEMVKVVALCDVDSNNLAAASSLHPKAKTFSDYRVLFDKMAKKIDAVIISTPDHTHAPASLMAMEMNKPVYCQKPLTHHVLEARAVRKMAADKNLTTQMGIQIHSFKEYRSAVHLIQNGIIGKVHTVRAWSPKNWGYDGPIPTGSDPVPANLDWNLWLGTAPQREYKDGYYHPGNWRKVLDFGCGTLGDMGVHIFDTPYTALSLDVPATITTQCREPNGFGYPENNVVTYEFPGTEFTTDTLKWVWYDGPGAPTDHEELRLPNMESLPEQGSMFIGEKGRLLLPHWDFPKLIVDGKYEPVDYPDLEPANHYHQFVDACLGNDTCSAPFSYAARLTEAILLGVVANRFPNKTLHWNNGTQLFDESEANQYLTSSYRKF
ncbi:Gfo/Idh/MocA family protein [Fulvivirga sedimenti]|uniref:Gfo/Idh/MocA family oxidoreductase n=1 Tax=Fulvivirga sedimenti TaxID=2879465 RepID=A0A9X1KYR5_9BACT|nr:Gfo/Idh/MocA family oxidoreductase [Fulvivirga sedimenti]MCA6075087.1 Gfo/Idh/MocA family oxidoreductase [Fulvivirga sedimenti]MCA6076264.1 Gfo/Idh/MocA family oxidoreductase [Fulvivirga sedimenti]MCA6077392.1 Gfo/Idh/MocA family oxidoreductase [Fulvivirga sedimenti]